jgi:hypothetical protein
VSDLELPEGFVPMGVRPTVEYIPPATPAQLSGLLFGALARAQANISNPGFDRENPHFRSKFASLAAVRDAIVPALAAEGIAVVQNLTTTETGVNCVTNLLHKDGGFMSFGPLFMPAAKADAWSFGSAAAYARRYALMAVACVVGDTDDDAQGAVNREPNFKLLDKVHAAMQVGMDTGDNWKVLESWEELDQDEKIEFYRHLSRWVPSGVTKWKAQHAAAITQGRVEIAKRNEPAVNTPAPDPEAVEQFRKEMDGFYDDTKVANERKAANAHGGSQKR